MVNNNQVNENELYLVEGDVDLTYALSQNGRTVTLTGSDGSTSSVTIPSAAAKQGSITTTTTWSGSGPYTQTVTVSSATTTSASKIDLQPNATTITQMIEDGVQALYVVNNNGTLTMYAVGAAPTVALTIQCTVTEVG